MKGPFTLLHKGLLRTGCVVCVCVSATVGFVCSSKPQARLRPCKLRPGHNSGSGCLKWHRAHCHGASLLPGPPRAKQLPQKQLDLALCLRPPATFSLPRTKLLRLCLCSLMGASCDIIKECLAELLIFVSPLPVLKS